MCLYIGKKKRGGVDDASVEHSVSVCSLWPPQGISDRSEGLGPGYSFTLIALILVPEGSHLGLLVKLVPSLGGVWVGGWIDIGKCGTTCLPPGSLMCWGRLSVCLGVYLLLRRLVRVEGYGGMVGGLGPDLGPVLLLGLSDKAPPGKVASEMTEFLPPLGRPQSDALRT